MNSRRAALLAALYTAIVVAGSLGLRGWLTLTPRIDRPSAIIASVWMGGDLVARAIHRDPSERDARIDAASSDPSSELVLESVVAEGPLLVSPEVAFALSLVSGHDGVVARLGGREAFVTPDDLIARRAYDHGVRVLGLDVPLGVDAEVVFALLSERLDASAERVRREASIRRIRVLRATPRRPPPPWARVDGESLTTDEVRDAARDAARFLARGVNAEGRFTYMMDARSGRALAGYDWPRHAGATYFLAQAAARFHDPEVAIACLRAAALVRDAATTTCGAAACVGNEARVDVGSSSLALLAFVEIVRSGLDPTYAEPAARLALFLRSQQRPDGEFRHEFDRASGLAIDVQYPYYSGEASLALARANRLAGDPDDLSAATRGLAHLVGPAWSFFGSRYYFGEEHWTCQAMAELWDLAPDRVALDFCERWQAFGRRLQRRGGEAEQLGYDADGALGIGPFFTPRLTPVASRCEAGIATLDVVAREHRPGLAELSRQQATALALLVRRQLRPGLVALFARPDATYGAMPGSEVDLTLRIDYAQHAGSAMIRWLDLDARWGSKP